MISPNIVRKRVSVKNKCPNPLFEKWLSDWKEEASEKGSDMQYCFGKALVSLKKYPLLLKSGKECGILQNFGNRLCIMLDRKLAGYQKDHPEIDIDKYSTSNDKLQYDSKYCEPQTKTKKDKKRKDDKIPQPHSKIRQSRIYVPVFRSGAYALLITLLNKSNGLGFMTKSELHKEAQPLSDSSFTTPLPGSNYTAWSSMSILVKKGLVSRCGNPARFSLTKDGEKMAHELLIVGIKNHDLTSANKDCRRKAKNKLSPMPLKKHKSIIEPTTINVQKTSFNAETAETVIFSPGSFEVILLVDTQETSASSKGLHNDPTFSELTNFQIKFEVRHLKVGDFVWVCRNHNTNMEMVLPYIIERKRMDDLSNSIKDGRFHEQKFRLKQCGVQNLIYLVESHGNNQHTGLPLATLQQAIVNTQVVDGFMVKQTSNHRESMSYLATLTKLLSNSFNNKTLVSCHKQDIPPFNITDDLVSLITFTEFSKLSGKTRNYKVKEMFVKHLLQLRGLSVEKALAIVEKYGTPQTLLQAYEKGDGEKLLAGISHGSLNRLLGPVISKAIHQLYTNSVLTIMLRDIVHSGFTLLHTADINFSGTQALGPSEVVH
ncbi:unnamed protein product [Timema podura]|uniref:Crossover junction endonuclease MUS81 n=1 Tax=Timema podura TaxID=61482 RepID=A0ABN7NCU8_TIMPD|nr:unnamed protein product [Timema podura]